MGDIGHPRAKMGRRLQHLGRGSPKDSFPLFLSTIRLIEGTLLPSEVGLFPRIAACL